MSKSIKILLLAAALLYSGNATASLITFSGIWSPTGEEPVTILSSVLNAQSTPQGIPARQQADRGIYLSDTFSERDLNEIQEESRKLSELAALKHKRVSENLFISRPANLGFELKKIIYPFHSFF